MIIAGASPKEMASMSESSSTPNRLPVPVARAIRPSNASQTPPSTMNSTARANSAMRRRDDREDAEEQIAEREPVGQGRGGTAHVGPPKPPRHDSLDRIHHWFPGRVPLSVPTRR